MGRHVDVADSGGDLQNVDPIFRGLKQELGAGDRPQVVVLQNVDPIFRGLKLIASLRSA